MMWGYTGVLVLGLKISEGCNKTLPIFGSPGSTSTDSFELVLSNKYESCIGQLFMRSLNYAI